jgi:lipid-binding SYLF domain-containing protein
MREASLIRVVALAIAVTLASPGAVTFAAPQQDPPTKPRATAQDPQTPREDIEEYVERTQDSIATLQELTNIPANAIPQYLLDRAEAIVVIPSLVRGGFIVGGKHGKGVMSVRNRAGAAAAWSNPAFVNLSGGSIGWQIGAEAVDLVLLVMNKEGIDKLLTDKLTLGGNLSVAAGPVGRSADAATNVRLDAQILAYSRAKGLFAGATFEGAALHANDSANKAFYGRELKLRDILYGDTASTNLPSIAQTWKTTLTSLTSGKSPERR